MQRMLVRTPEVQLQDGVGSHSCVCFVSASRLRHVPRPLRCWIASNRHQTSSHRLTLRCRGHPSGPWFGCRSASAAEDIHCVPRIARHDAPVTGSVFGPSAKYVACVFPACSTCPGGFSTVATCFASRAQKRKRRFKPVEQSPFLVGIHWHTENIPNRYANAEGIVLKILACWSQLPCVYQCADDQVEARTGSYMLPTDLFRFSVYIGLHTAGRMIFSAFFERKAAESSPPCEVTVRAAGPRKVTITWTMFGHRRDGFLVSMCPAAGPCASVALPPNQTSVGIGNLPPSERLRYFVRSFRGNPSSPNVTYSVPAAASWKVDAIFDMMEFLMAAVLAVADLVLLGFLMAMRRRCYVPQGGGEHGEAEAAPRGLVASQGDHRGLHRLLPPQPQRVTSRGDI